MDERIDGQAVYSLWRKGLRRALIVAIAVLAMVGATTYGIASDLGGWVTWMGLWVAIVCIAWLAVVLRPREWKVRRWIPVLVSVLIGIGLGFGIGRSVLMRARCGAHMFSMRSVVDSLDGVARSRLDTDGELPSSLLVLFSDPAFEMAEARELFDRYCCQFSPSRVRVDDITLSQIVNDRVTHEQVVDQCDRVRGDARGWELYESIGYLRDERAWQSGDPRLIVLWMVYEGTEGDVSLYLGTATDAYGYADVQWATPRDLGERLDLHDSIATTLGVAPAPPELRAWCQ